MSWIKNTVCMIGLLLIPWSAAAQEGTLDASFEGSIEVSEVLLDVLAVDRQGTIVTGLGKDDFLVEEDG